MSIVDFPDGPQARLADRDLVSGTGMNLTRRRHVDFVRIAGQACRG
jgi:hypothetical protein